MSRQLAGGRIEAGLSRMPDSGEQGDDSMWQGLGRLVLGFLCGALVAIVAVAGTPSGLEGTADGSGGQPIEQVLLLTRWSPGGIGGMVIMKYVPAVLYRDGTYSTDAERALDGQARLDGRWRREGGGWLLTDQKGKTERVEAKMAARPAPAGHVLAGRYRSLGGAGLVNTNVPSVSAYQAFEFQPDGRLDLGQGGGASGGGVVAYGKSQSSARYRLDGWTIRLTHADGRIEQRLFYLFPDGDRGIGVGRATLSARK